MIDAELFMAEAEARGIGFYAGVPCSFLTPLMNAVIGNGRTSYVGAASEGEAVAIAAGAWLAGRDTAVMCQNSGLGNTVNPLTSLNWTFRIPTLLVVTWRGQPGIKDEPQHELMGQITPELLDLMRIRNAPFPAEPERVAPVLDTAAAHMQTESLPFALIQPKGAVSETKLTQAAPQRGTRAEVLGAFSYTAPPRRIEAIEHILAALPADAPVIATTGYCGRELYGLGDEARNFYMVGSMGGASAIGLGVALKTGREVAVLDGDGAALMKLGNLSTIGAAGPRNLTHIILDNEMHESTGGQMTVSAGVDFAAIAAAAGYAHAARADSLAGLDEALKRALAIPGPRLIHVKVGPSRVADLPRPEVTPFEVARRFRTFLANGAAA